MCVCVYTPYSSSSVLRSRKRPDGCPSGVHLDQLASATLELRELQRVLRMYVPLSVCLYAGIRIESNFSVTPSPGPEHSNTENTPIAISDNYVLVV